MGLDVITAAKVNQIIMQQYVKYISVCKDLLNHYIFL
nr:MAG TPA: hypothetical protein [Caudoviricetes sp.]